MGLETGTYVNDLEASNPLGSDDRKEGDNHLRLIKSVLKTTFPNASKSYRFPTTALSATATVNVVFPDDQNKLFPVNATGGSITVNLPDPSSGGTANEDGFAITVVKTDSSANPVVVQASGGQTISGATSIGLAGQWEQALLVWDKLDAKWYALTPGILTHQTLQAAASLLTLRRTENDTTEREIDRVLAGNGAGDTYTRRLVGTGANAVDFIREYIGAVKLTELDAAYLALFVRLIMNNGSANTITIHQDGYVELLEITPPASPAANNLRLYSKDVSGTTRLAYKDSAGAESVLLQGGIVDVQTFNADGTWTKPLTGSIARVQCWGGGGGGGNGASGDPGGGGGGGSYHEKFFALSDLASTENVTIGQGGAGEGNAGGSTTFGLHLTAFGGGSGFGSTNAGDGHGGGGGGPLGVGANATIAGPGNGGSPSAGAGYVVDSLGVALGVPAHNPAGGGGGGRCHNGSADGVSSGGNSFWGGGGGGGGPSGSGGKSVWGGGGGGATGSGAGGTSVYGGAGGAGGAGSGNNGTNGTAPGGGGGGATQATSGSGAAGRCVVTVW